MFKCNVMNISPWCVVKYIYVNGLYCRTCFVVYSAQFFPRSLCAGKAIVCEIYI